MPTSVCHYQSWCQLEKKIFEVGGMTCFFFLFHFKETLLSSKRNAEITISDLSCDTYS